MLAGCFAFENLQLNLYVSHKNVPGFRTYFGVNLFDNRGLKKNVDFWLSGLNVGFEVCGNYRAEVEAKNINVVCYDKKILS